MFSGAFLTKEARELYKDKSYNINERIDKCTHRKEHISMTLTITLAHLRL